MSVPDRRESAALLLSVDPPPWHLRHSRAVAEVAAWLGARAAVGGVSLDRRLIESAALLHDSDKVPRVRAVVESLPHGEGSASWLAAQGHPELGPVVAGHPVTRLADGAWFEGWLATASPEALIVAYADKRAGQRLETMAARFASWRRRYPPDERRNRPRGSWTAETVEAVWGRALQLEAAVCHLVGASPPDVGRVRWTASALRAAAAEVAARPRAEQGPATTAGVA